MGSCQIQVRINGVWLPVGARLSLTSAASSRREWIKSASRDNGPDAAQYVRAHSRVIRYIEKITTTVVEEE